MSRSDRMFEIIQVLRAASRPVRAQDLAERFEVSQRIIYRDIAALQAMRTPIDGEAGIGYLLRSGYDLPPLNFDAEEIEALRVGLMMLSRTGDSQLQIAARRVGAKIEALQQHNDWLQVAPWGAPPDDPEQGCVSIASLRSAIRQERKLQIIYRDQSGSQSERIIRPIAVIYHLECVLLIGWCELRGALRHFRTDRIYGCQLLDESFEGESLVLRRLWREQETLKLADPPNCISRL